ncbi:cytochrome-c peroxidase [Mesonia sp.]|uniref:cytochrome-c peroxidase n=1 Tax=Mesonia sp. TaxID=1960830 RepID=UPI003F9838C0
MNKINFFLCFYLSFFIVSCSVDYDEDYSQETPQDWLGVPSYFPMFPENPNNPITKKGVLLGEKLFFDKRLSGNNQISCATCHQPELSFTEGSVLSTKGISGIPLLRHVPPIINLAWSNNGLFWDGGSTNLESQALAPLAHQDEMYQDLDELLIKLSEGQEYKNLFEDVFQDKIKISLVMKALAQYQRSIIYAQSPYDFYLQDKNHLNTQESKGLKLFKVNCAKCHQDPLFTDNDYHNNGLDDSFTDTSYDEIYLGRYRITRNIDDIGKYKTPTLRNIEITAPYMHDGRFSSLREVLDFYDNGVKNSETLDPILKQNNGIALSEQDKDDLIAFLKSLTDINL